MMIWIFFKYTNSLSMKTAEKKTYFSFKKKGIPEQHQQMNEYRNLDSSYALTNKIEKQNFDILYNITDRLADQVNKRVRY